MSSAAPRLAIGVAIATIGRPNILAAIVDAYRRQSRAPDAIFVCAPTPTDVTNLTVDQPSVSVIFGPPGSCVQRNYIIDRAVDYDVLLFSDDDFLPRNDYIEVLEKIFLKNPDIVMTTGYLIADGAVGPGLDLDCARYLIAADVAIAEDTALAEIYNGYGCNMAVRVMPLRQWNIRFDENLPFYGWLEDVDLSRRLSRYGRIVKAGGTRGVHMGAKVGRQPGKRLGYSQIANPLYLARKGTLSWRRALAQMGRNITANGWHCLKPEPNIDHRGRLKGNAIALTHLITARLHPRRVQSL
jgi:GT2 family glycosyltransferase